MTDFDGLSIKLLQNLSLSIKISGQMQPEERQHRIGEFLQRVEFASLEEIAKEVDASLSTIRRDLTILETSGAIRRTHGGARIVVPKSDEFAFSSRDTHQLAEKEAI